MTKYRRRAHWRPMGSGMVWHRWRTNKEHKGDPPGCTSDCGLTQRVLGPADPTWARPPALARCARCDAAEINECVAEASLDEVRRTGRPPRTVW